MHTGVLKRLLLRSTTALLVACSLILPIAGTAHAAGVVGDGTPDSCTEAALASALAGGGTVTFSCGGPKTILVLHEQQIAQNTVIDGSGVITITGGLATRLFSVPATAALAMRNIVLDSAFSTNGSGGAIFAGGPLTLTNVTIRSSQTSTQYCGGAMVVASNTTITDSTFTGNTAGLGGGAICVRSQPNTSVQIANSLFVNNKATNTTTGLGGALYVEYGSATVRDSAFVSNSAHFGGAAYVAASGALVLQGSPTSSVFASKLQVNGNSATEDGGALYNKGGALTIANAVITVNRAPMQTILAGYGGGIYSEGTLTMTNGLLYKNEGRFGGGVFVGNSASARAEIDRISFRGNLSGSLGGGLYTNSATTAITVTNSAFSGNAAPTGGGIGLFNTGLRLINSSVTGNIATSGGGIYIGAGPAATDGKYVHVESVTISENTASSNQGGGVLSTGRVELYSTSIISNTGSGVHSTLGGNTRFRNTVLRNPNALNCDGDGTAQISDDTHNFSTDSSCVLPNSQTGPSLDPKLGPLTPDPNGLTSYHLPLAGSPLIDAGFNCPTLDQRGASRPNTCDIGAVEFGGVLPAPPSLQLYIPLVAK
jgi:predicted outer membrane repeat protein